MTLHKNLYLSIYNISIVFYVEVIIAYFLLLALKVPLMENDNC